MQQGISIIACLMGLMLLAAACGGSDPAPAATPTVVLSPTQEASPAPSAIALVPTTEPTAAAPATATTAPPPPPPPPPPAQPTAQPQPTTPPAAAVPPPAVRFEVVADDEKFDKTELRARAGAAVTAVMRNNDNGIDHNLSFNIPGLDHGDTCPGPCTATQTFTAPAAGRYNFFCTIHAMVGDFIVEP